jgi:hypothetical protein
MARRHPVRRTGHDPVMAPKHTTTMGAQDGILHFDRELPLARPVHPVRVPTHRR